ncbi:MAG: thymidylate synthase [bacterium]
MTNWPIYFKDKLHIANLESNVGVVTLWTPMQAILPKLDQTKFCIGGQLYSKRGINFIIRNILANPIIDTIIICGANRSESAEALMNFLDKGIDENYQVIGVEKAFVDKEISKEAINEMRSRVKYINLVNNSSSSAIQTELAKVKQSKTLWGKPQIFPEPEVKEVDKLPSETSTYTIRAGYIKDAWPQILRHIMRFGSKKGMIKVGEVRELVNLIVTIEEENPDKPDIPEWFNFNKDDLKLYLKGFFERTKASEDYGYGQRIFSHPLGIPDHEYNSPNNTNTYSEFKARHKKADNPNEFVLNQLEEVYLKLQRYKYDRGGVISIWNPWADNISKGWMSKEETKVSGNVPCMTQLQFAYREHRLHLTAYFRSNDMFDAWPRNTFALRKLQFELAKKLDMKPGYLTIISSLAQIYEPNYDEARKLLEKFANTTNCQVDHRGVIIIELDGKDIVAKHMDPSGNEQLEEFRIDGTKPKSAQMLSDILLTNLVFSETPHAMDIARELQKAEIAVKNNLEFKQDQELVI